MRLAWVLMLSACASSGPVESAVASTARTGQAAPERLRQETSTQEVMLAEVKRILKTAQAEVRGCYEAVLTPIYHPDIDLVIRLILRADGTVRRVEVVRMKPDVAGLVACFSGVLADLRFPKDSEDWELEFPVKLRSGGMADDVEDATPKPEPKPEPAP